MGSKHELAVREAADEFYDALNAMFKGDIALMKAIWSHADDVVYMGPGGSIKVGWAKVLKDWESQAARKLGGNVMAKDVNFTIGDDIAVMYAREMGENTNIGGKREKVDIRVTNLFRKENGAWKVIGHHTDLLAGIKG
jgi:ketosteroid isomerase-like protein